MSRWLIASGNGTAARGISTLWPSSTIYGSRSSAVSLSLSAPRRRDGFSRPFRHAAAPAGLKRYYHHLPTRHRAQSLLAAVKHMEQPDIQTENGAFKDGSTGTHNAWIGAAAAGGYDLRSDTMTTPTASMLAAIQQCTLLDDVMMEDPTTMNLEAHCAALTGKEAGLFVLSGTMGNQLALRSLLVQPPYGVLCDPRSHIVKYEAGGVSSLTGASVKTVAPANGRHLTLEDIQANAALDDDVHTCPTRVISLENTLNGMVMPLSEARRTSAWAREHGIKVHCDGARLWEAVAAGAGSLTEYAACFDTVSLCFSKGLGAPVGSVLVGSKDVIRHSRWVRKSIGGGLRQPGVVTAAARVAVDETFGKGPTGEGGLLRETHVLAKQIEKTWTDLGGKLIHPVETNMIWLDLDDAGCAFERVGELGEDVGLKLLGNRLIVHYQIYQNRSFVLPRLEKVFRRIFEEKAVNGVDGARKSVGETSQYQRQ